MSKSKHLTSSTQPSNFDTLPFNAVLESTKLRHQTVRRCIEKWEKVQSASGSVPSTGFGDGALGLHKIIWTGLGWPVLKAALLASQDWYTLSGP